MSLWAGVELKVSYAEFFLRQMERALQPPERTQARVALESAGAIVVTLWQQSFYPNFDAFLAMARSIPEIIQSCFGKDVRSGFNALPLPERTRREAFSTVFEPFYAPFRMAALSTARNVSLHRTGYSSVEVEITGRFGVVYEGSAVEGVPTAESPQFDGDAPSWAGTQPPPVILPQPSDFSIDGTPLFDACQAYLAQAQNLVTQARDIGLRVHGTNSLTAPS